jgi:hypothetical protein
MPRLPQHLNDANIVLRTRLDAMVSGHGIEVKERLRVGTSTLVIGVAGRRQALLHPLEQPQRGAAVDHDVPRVHVAAGHVVERPAGVGRGGAPGVHLEQLAVDPGGRRGRASGGTSRAPSGAPRAEEEEVRARAQVVGGAGHGAIGIRQWLLAGILRLNLAGV